MRPCHLYLLRRGWWHQ